MVETVFQRSDSLDISLDVSKWAGAKYWTWLEAEYILVGLDPQKIKKIEPGIALDLKDRRRRAIREEIEFHYRTEEIPARLSPSDAVEIMSRAGTPVCSELKRAIQTAEEQIAGEDHPHSIANALHARGTSRDRRSGGAAKPEQHTQVASGKVA